MDLMNHPTDTKNGSMDCSLGSYYHDGDDTDILEDDDVNRYTTRRFTNKHELVASNTNVNVETNKSLTPSYSFFHGTNIIATRTSMVGTTIIDDASQNPNLNLLENDLTHNTTNGGPGRKV